MRISIELGGNGHRHPGTILVIVPIFVLVLVLVLVIQQAATYYIAAVAGNSTILVSLFLGPMLIATGRPFGPINAVNGSNDGSCWHSHSFYGLNNKN